MSKYHIVIIGGGGTGAALAHDLVQRGFRATLFERGELTSGTTGRHHGQLHSGARYAVGDREIARECMDETRILRTIAPESIESNYGLFVALTDEDVEFEPQFVAACREAGIPARRVSVAEARQMEPGLSPEIKKVVLVPDGTIDAWRLPLQFFATAKHAGAAVHSFTPVTGILRSNGMVTGVEVQDLRTRKRTQVHADLVINATGAWAGKVAALADVDLPLTPAPGTLVAVKDRLVNMVISHLHMPGDGDIVVPQRRLSIVGTTQWTTREPDLVRTPEDDISYLLREAARMVPAFENARVHAAWAAVRPLAGSSDSDARELSRDFQCIDHAVTDGVEGFISVTGGKATVLRAMAEKVVNLTCRKLGINAACRTAEMPLLSHRAYFSLSEAS